MISVVIPSLNPESVQPLVHTIKTHLLSEHEILVQTDQGYVQAVLSGIKKSKGEVIVIIDGDGSHNPVYFQDMFKLLEKFDIVIGSRYVIGAKSDDVLIRRLISRLFCKGTRALLGLNQISDVMSGFIVVRKEVLNQICINSIGYKIGISILMQAKNRFTIAEYPITFKKSSIGNYVKLRNIRDGVQTLIFIGKLFIYRFVLEEKSRTAR
jgi:dolichol-phosphate mannosyltransferase